MAFGMLCADYRWCPISPTESPVPSSKFCSGLLLHQLRRAVQTSSPLPSWLLQASHRPGLYTQVLGSQSGRSIHLVKRLICMYGKRGHVEEEGMVFDPMCNRNVESWTAMIADCIQQGHGREALKLLLQMQQSVRPNKITYITALTACANPLAMAEGKMLHALIVESGFELDVIVASALVSMYGRCGSVDSGQILFDKMHHRNLVSWNAMIAVCAHNRNDTDAIKVFRSMNVECVKPDIITFVSILSACAGLAALGEGKKIHTEIIESGIELSVVVHNALLNMYGKCGSIDNALRVFKTMHHLDVVSWNTMIAAYTQHRQYSSALELFGHMQLEAVKPDRVTFITILNACANSIALEAGKFIHNCVVESGLQSNVVVGSSLVSMYGKCGSVQDAYKVFLKMHHRNLVSWNALIDASVEHGHAMQALRVYQQMQLEGVEPDEITFMSLLTVCASMAAVVEGKMIHSHLIDRGFDSEGIVGSALVNMYAKCGQLEDAWHTFNNVHQRDVVLWTAMIAALSQNENPKDAIQLFQTMQLDGIQPNEITFITVLQSCVSPSDLADGKVFHAQLIERGLESNTSVGNALINMYGTCGTVTDAQRIFERMHEPTVISWTAIIFLHSQCGHGEDALHLFRQMQMKGLEPNEITFVGTLSACASQVILAEGKIIYASILQHGLEYNTVLQNAVINMYARCGSNEDALRIFNKMHQRSVTTWNAMIATCARYGLGQEALKLFQQMQQSDIEPDEVTLLSVLSACNHAGMLEEGCKFFSSMYTYGIPPAANHYACLIDLFARAGQLDNAESFIKKLPFQPGTVEWMTLLGACRNHGDFERGQQAAKGLLEFDLQCSAAYITLSNMYAEVVLR